MTPAVIEGLPPRRNVEIKAHLRDVELARKQAARIGAKPMGFLRQVDTYFRAAHGQLKLRETLHEPAVLIWYHRPADPKSRLSEYLLTPVADPEAMKQTLTLALGCRGQIVKTRELWLYENVRIHLDDIEGLGHRVEFEAVLPAESSLDAGHAIVHRLRDHFGIQPGDLIAESNAAWLPP